MALRTATNPQTGERVAYVMGEWVPYRPDQTAPAGQTTPPADQPPEEPSALQTYVTDPLKRGVGALGQAAGAIGAKTGIISPETAAGIIVKSNAFAEAAKRRPQDEAALKEIGDAPDLKSAAVAALKHPSAWLLTMMESLPQSSLSILGGLFGSVLGPAGTAGGAGAGSAATEYSASLIQAMQNLNVDLRDPKAVENALTSPRFMEYASQYAAKRAAGVGALDAVGGGVAGRLVGGARGVGSTVVRGAGEGAVQAGTGAAGEAIGQRNVGEYKPGDIVMEAAAELPASIGEVATGAAHARRKAAAGAGGATLPGGAATTGKPVTGTAPAAAPSGTKPPSPAIGAPPAVIPPVTVPTEVGPAPAPIPTAQPAPATAAPIAPQATGGTAAPKTTAGASPIVKKAAANLAKILPETWDPVHADPDDPNSPVLAYHNEATGETRTPDQHLAPIATPLSGFEPVIAPPSVIAEQVAKAKEEGRKEAEASQPVRPETPAPAPKVETPKAETATPAAATSTAAEVKAVEAKLAAEQTVAEATAARSEANAFTPTHTDTQTGKPVEVEVSGPVRRVKYADGTTREERAVKAVDRYQPIGAAVPEVPNVSEAPATNKPSAPIVSQPGRPDPQKGIDRKKANAEAAARPLPTMAEIHAAADQAADPTPAQAESGNYKKGHLQLHGIDISVETPRGGIRRGVGSDGKPWETKLQFPYGYIKKTKGADGEQVDTYLAGREPHVYVVDQIDPATGQFDETKSVIGTRNEKRARAVYEAGFSDKSGKKRLGAITPMDMDAYKEWLANGDHSKPVAYKPKGTVNPSPPAAPKARPAPEKTKPFKFDEKDAADLGKAHADLVRSIDGFKADGNEKMRAQQQSRLNEFLQTIRRDFGVEAVQAVAAESRRLRGDTGGGKIGPAVGDKLPAAEAAPPTGENAQVRKSDHGEMVPPAAATDQDQPSSQAADQPAVRDTPSPEPAKPEGYGAGNKLFSADAAAKARARLKAKLSGSQLNAGFDPEIMLDGLTLAGYHVEAGARTFAAYSKAILEDLGEGARPYLAYWYNAVRDYPGFDTEGMDSREDVAAFARMTGKEAAKAPPPEPVQAPAAEEPPARTPEPAATEAPPRASEEPAAPVPEIPKATDPKVPGIMQLAKGVRDSWVIKLPIKMAQLQKNASDIFGGTMASGAFDSSDLNEALEVGTNLAAIRSEANAETTPVAVARAGLLGRRLTELWPTQTRRTDEKIAFQQFSTPTDYAYAAARVANIAPGDVVLEPSAGTGSLAAWAKAAGARTIVNEISPRRRGLLEAMGFDKVMGEDAEQLHNLLPDEDRPTVVVMNPPFSNAGHRGVTKDLMIGAKHIDAALKVLQDGGRLVAIVGRGMAMDAPTFTKWWNDLRKTYTVKANIAVAGDVYKKLGTAFGTRLLVIDKTGPQTGAIVSGEVDAIPDLIRRLEDVRDARTQPRPVEPGSRAEAGGDGDRVPVDQQPAAADAGSGGAGAGQPGRGSGRSGGAGAEPDASPDAGTAGTGGQAIDNAPAVPGGRPKPAAGAPATKVQAAKPRGSRKGPAATGPGSATPDATELEPAQAAAAEPTDALAAAAATDAAIAARGEINADDVFETYQPPALTVKGAKRHPTDLVQSAAMAAVDSPKLTYRPNLPKAVVEGGVLSDVQIESVAYAGQAHERMLQDGQTRRGFFIGDGTGVGKGRQIAAIIQDNFRQGRRKAVWLSQSQKLYQDAGRDWGALGGDLAQLANQSKTGAGEQIKHGDGILFATYKTLSMGSMFGPKGELVGTKGSKSRLLQLAGWLGDPEKFDGVIVFDEAHLMGNAMAMKGDRGTSSASQQAMAGIELQRRFPKARIVYASATGATEVSNLAYADRLGLWGDGTSFATKAEFVNKIAAGGVAAMEFVARDLKAQGSYLARSLSMKGVQYERLEHTLTDDQRLIYDKLAEAWRTALQHFDVALEKTEAGKNGHAKSAAKSAFWSTNQRFWNQVMTSMQMPSLLDAIDEDIKAGRSPVIQLVNTNEAQLDRAIDDAGDQAVLDLDMTPRDTLIDMIREHYPVQQYETKVDPESGKKFSVPVIDSQGNPVLNKEMVAKRDALIEDLSMIRVPLGPLEMLFQHVPADLIAEATGRGKRIEYVDGKQVIKPRSPAMMARDIAEFQNDKRRIMIFSDAGGTGASYHADKGAKNQRLRRHYLLQAGWRADKAVQGFGRTHRTNQAQAPEYVLVTTDLKGQKRFISSIARRLAQLGALTKGQRQTSDGMFSERDNLEGPYATSAVKQLFGDVMADRVPSITKADLIAELGFDNIFHKETGQLLDGKIPSVPQFLNRILSVSIDRQNLFFDAFQARLDANIAAAMERGELDTGLQTVKAISAKRVRDELVNTDEATGAKAFYAKVEVEKPRHLLDWEAASRFAEGFAVNVKSGKVWGYGKARSSTNRQGQVRNVRTLVSPTGEQSIDAAEFDTAGAWRKVGKAEAKLLYGEAYDAAPKTRKKDLHLLTGSLLPIWNRLPNQGQVIRLQLDSGEVLIGREIPDKELDATLERLQVGAEKVTLTGQQAIDTVLNDGAIITLANGWRIFPVRVAGETRIEVAGPSYANKEQLDRAGVFREQHSYQTRWFVPTAKPEAMDAVMAGRPPIRVQKERETDLSFTMADLDPARTQLQPAAAEMVEAPPMMLGRTLATGKLSDPEWAKIRKALDADLALMARQLAGSRIQTSAIDSIMLDGAAGRYIGGTQLRNLVTVSLLDADGNLRSYEDLLGTLRHEVIHFLKASGVIPRGSWAALESSARTWRKTFGIDDAYAYQNLTEAQLDEEAIAEAYNHWGKGQLKLDPVRATGMRAIARFLGAIRDRVRKALGLERIPTPQEIFEAIERGDFAAANPSVGEDTIAKTHLPRSAASVVFSQDDIAGNMRQLEGLNYALIQKAMSAGMRGKAGSLIDHTRRVIQDRFLFVRRAEEAVEAATGAPLPEEAQPYLQEMLYHGKVAEAKFELDHRFKEPILAAMQHAGLKLDEVENYLYALHAPERNRRIASINPKYPDGGSGMDTEVAEKIVQAVNDGPAEKRIALGQIRDLVRGMMEQRLQIMQDSGLISAATAQTWRDTYQEYVPLRGVEADPDAEAEEALRPKVSRGFMGVRRLEPRAYGRGSRANHPLATAFMLADEAIVRAAKNEVQLAVLNLAQLAPDPNVWEVSPVKRQPYMATMADGTQQVRYRNMPHDDAKDTVIARIDGRPFRIQIHEPYMLRALSNLGASDLPSMMRWLATMTGTLSKLNTMWNPEFVITNAFMDALAGLVNLGKEEQAGLRREVIGSYNKARKGTWRYLKSGDTSTEWAQHAQEFRQAGGATAFNDIADVESQARSIEKQLAQLQNPRGFMANATKLVGVIERANTSIDNAMRLATFVALRNRGYSPAQAARVAKNLTINFNRKGELGPIANSLWMFSNAAIQGTATMATALRHKGVRRFVYSAVALGVAMELMGGGWEPPEDDDGTGLSVYDRVPEWEKNTNLIFAYGPEPGQYIKIRTPYGYGFFVSLGRLSAAYMRGAKEATGDPVSLAMTLSKLASSFATNMLPGALTSGFVPTVAQPFADIASNSDWTGRAIMPNLFPGQNKPDSQLYYPSIDPYTKWTADMMNRLTGGNEFRPGLVDVSPESMSHVIKTYAGAAGAFVVRSVSAITRATGEATGSNEEDPALGWSDVPFVRKLRGSASPWQVKDITYQRLAELEILEDEAKGTTPAARAVRSAERRRLALVDDGRKLRRNLSDLRKERNRTIEDDKLSTGEKRARTDKIAEREKKLITRFNAAYSKAVSARPQ